MPRRRSPAIDNLVLDGVWAHERRDLSRAAIDVYPPLVYLQLDAVFTLVRPFAPDGPPQRTAAHYIVAGRAVSALMTLLAALLAGWTAVRLSAERRAGPIAAALVLFNPAALYYAHTTNAEASYVAYTTLAFALLAADRGWATAGFFCAAGLAVAAKDQAAFVLAGPLLWALWRRPRVAAAGLVAGTVLYLLAYLPGGGLALLRRHFDAMRKVQAGFTTHGSGPLELLALAARFAWDLLRVAGPVALLGAAAWLAGARRDHARRPWAVVLCLAGGHYLAAILFLAHRTNPRYALPFLPLLAAPAAILLARTRSRPLVLLLLGACLVWGAGLPLHLRGDPVDAAKRALREMPLPRGARLAVFTLTRGQVWSQGPDGRWQARPLTRDWTEEKIGWVAEGIEVVGLLPDPAELQQLFPELVLYADNDPVPPPRAGYQLAGRFEPALGGAYNWLQRQRGLALYVRER